MHYATIRTIDGARCNLCLQSLKDHVTLFAILKKENFLRLNFWSVHRRAYNAKLKGDETEQETTHPFFFFFFIYIIENTLVNGMYVCVCKHPFYDVASLCRCFLFFLTPFFSSSPFVALCLRSSQWISMTWISLCFLQTYSSFISTQHERGTSLVSVKYPA